MIRRVFLDADVILDLLLARRPFLKATRELFSRIEDGALEAWASPLIFSNLYYILRKELGGRRALAALRKLRLLTEIATIDEQALDRALASSFPDFEDALQYYAAVHRRVDALLTRNRRHYKDAELPILSAGECVAMIVQRGR